MIGTKIACFTLIVSLRFMMKELKLNASVKDFIALKSLILKLCLLIPLITPSVIYAEPFKSDGNQVLVIESLGPEFPFVRRLISSIESELIKQEPNHQLYVEYLESTRLTKSDKELDAYANYLSARYKNLKFDRVIFRGAQAQAFAQKHLELFPEAFKVGEGQSNLQEQYLNIVSYEFNADLFFKNAIEVVDPNNIVIINGRLNYPGADAHLDLMLSSLKRLNFGGEVISIRPRTMADLILQMERVEENSLIVLSQFSPPNDWRASPQEFVSFLSEMREAPVFVTHETLLLRENGSSTGAAGGKLVSLAGLAKVLTGGDSSLGQLSDDYPELYDGKVLAEWKIPASRLSPDAVLISDYPLSLWQAYFYEVILAIAGFALLIIYTSFIKAKLGREFQAKEQLLTREANYVELLESKTEELEKRNQVVTALRDNADRERRRIEHFAEVADIAFFDFDFASQTLRGNSVLYHRSGLENSGKWFSVDKIVHRLKAEDAIELDREVAHCAQLEDGQSHTFYLTEKVGESLMTSMVTGVISKTTHHHRFYGASINVTELIDSKEKLSSAINNLEIFKIRRDQLLGMVAHEIRTPAASISMLSTEVDQETWISNQSRVQQQVTSLISAIDDLKILVDGKLERPVLIEHTDIVALSEDISQCVSSLVAATGLHFENICAIPQSLSKRSFRLDAYRTRLAVSSLIKSSCLYSQASDVWMITRIKQSKDSNRYIEWVVGDNGSESLVDMIKPADGEVINPPSLAGITVRDIEGWIIDLGGK
ncbi:MAG: hypothetical protein RL143_699, partial [Pseudomonadota bacterium]